MPRYELNENPYQESDLQFIKDHASKGPDWIAQQLNRSRSSIVNRAWRSQISLKVPGKRNGRNIGGWLKNRPCIYPKKPSYKFAKKYVMVRDNYTCVYCGAAAQEIDHVIPRQIGGSNMPSNLVASCSKCNNYKSVNCVDCPQWRKKRGI
jgi:hypothetical protein